MTDWARVEELVRRTRKEQGLPPTITNPATLQKAADLMGDWLIEQADRPRPQPHPVDPRPPRPTRRPVRPRDEPKPQPKPQPKKTPVRGSAA